MSTIIVGDVAEGSKWWSAAHAIKVELERQYKQNNAFMQTWKQVTADVKIHAIMRAGKPVAFIYVNSGEGDYEFFTPTSLISFANFKYGGVDFFKDKKNEIIVGGIPTERNVLLEQNYKSIPINTWYSQANWVSGGVAVRYANISLQGSGLFPNITFDFPARVYTTLGEGNALPDYTSPVAINAAATKGKYCFGITSAGMAYVWNMETHTQVFAQQITISVPADDSADLNVAGFWSFNRGGTKACTSAWISQYNRFHADAPLDPATAKSMGMLTSYVVEVSFNIDVNGIFTSLSVVQTVETHDFCVAADYDWTTTGNELITAQLTGFDYRINAATEWSANTEYNSVAFLKTTLSDGPIRRQWNLYEITFANNPPTFSSGTSGSTRPTHSSGSLTNGQLTLKGVSITPSAMDTWLYIKRLDGTVLKSIELMHNRDPVLDQSGTGWYDLRSGGSSFSSIISGIDLRVLGFTGYSTGFESSGNPPEAVMATLYGTTWNIASNMPTSNGATVYPTNYYSAGTLLRRIKMMNTPQTIAAMPNKVVGGIKNAAVYAPSSQFDPAFAIDFKIDGKGIEKDGYHRTIYSTFYGTAPYLDRYFIAGAWSNKLDKTTG